MNVDFLITGSIPPRVQIIAIGSSLLLLLFITHLIRGGRLKEGYSLIWLFIAIATVVFSVFTRLLDVFAHLIGISYTPAAMFLILVGGLYLLGIHFSLLLHRYDQRIRNMAQEHAILKHEVEGRTKEILK